MRRRVERAEHSVRVLPTILPPPLQESSPRLDLSISFRTLASAYCCLMSFARALPCYVVSCFAPCRWLITTWFYWSFDRPNQIRLPIYVYLLHIKEKEEKHFLKGADFDIPESLSIFSLEFCYFIWPWREKHYSWKSVQKHSFFVLCTNMVSSICLRFLDWDVQLQGWWMPPYILYEEKQMTDSTFNGRARLQRKSFTEQFLLGLEELVKQDRVLSALTHPGGGDVTRLHHDSFCPACFFVTKDSCLGRAGEILNSRLNFRKFIFKFRCLKIQN